jgi:hypothetical protein
MNWKLLRKWKKITRDCKFPSTYAKKTSLKFAKFIYERDDYDETIFNYSVDVVSKLLERYGNRIRLESNIEDIEINELSFSITQNHIQDLNARGYDINYDKIFQNELFSIISAMIENKRKDRFFYIHSFSSVSLISEASFTPRMIVTGNFRFSNIVDERKRKLNKLWK